MPPTKLVLAEPCWPVYTHGEVSDTQCRQVGYLPVIRLHLVRLLLERAFILILPWGCMCLKCVPHLLGSSWGRRWESQRELVEDIRQAHNGPRPHSFPRESFVWWDTIPRLIAAFGSCPWLLCPSTSSASALPASKRRVPPLAGTWQSRQASRRLEQVLAIQAVLPGYGPTLPVGTAIQAIC